MVDKARSRALAAELAAAFEAAGATPVEADILQPADTLLDLYGEDIRARAFVTMDPVRGEAMLRPDFTVPIVQMHQSNGNGAERYVYSGEVFRMQVERSERPAEYLQVGFERFGDDPAEADAEVFALFSDILSARGLAPATGDMGLLRAAVQGLTTSERRKAALLRHLWRPRRFRALVDRFRSPQAAPRPASGADSPEIGLRTRAEIDARLSALSEEAALPPLASAEAEVLDALLGLKEEAGQVLPQLRDLAVDLPALNAAADAFEARLAALAARGIDAARLPFEASYGRTSMEYYDGFVFGFYAPNRPDLPSVATGGRYDALTRTMGGPDASAAVGGVIRPGLLIELEHA
ncbi:MAG: ATP phosphoribosyltransferase regulatory subunit [Pseudomonadota bacterium]